MKLIKQIIAVLNDAENLARMKENVKYLEARIAKNQSAFDLLERRVIDPFGVSSTVAELVEKIRRAEENINYMSYENNSSEIRAKQQAAMERLKVISKDCEALIQELSE